MGGGEHTTASTRRRIFAAHSCCACFVAGEPGGGGICAVVSLMRRRRVVEAQTGARAGRSVCAGGGRLWARGCTAQRGSKTRGSPSDLDFQPVPVHGKKLNRRLIMDIEELCNLWRYLYHKRVS